VLKQPGTMGHSERPCAALVVDLVANVRLPNRSGAGVGLLRPVTEPADVSIGDRTFHGSIALAGHGVRVAASDSSHSPLSASR
jgi:hypothetical protein